MCVRVRACVCGSGGERGGDWRSRLAGWQAGRLARLARLAAGVSNVRRGELWRVGENILRDVESKRAARLVQRIQRSGLDLDSTRPLDCRARPLK